MLKIELNECGIENTLREIKDYLKSAIETSSKKYKNEMIYKALGAVNALYYVIDVTEVDNDTENEPDIY